MRCGPSQCAFRLSSPVAHDARPNSLRSSTLARSRIRRRSAPRLRPERLMWKLSIDIADWNGSAFRRRLASADLFNEAATACGERWVKTPGSRSRALLVLITRADQRRGLPRPCSSLDGRMRLALAFMCAKAALDTRRETSVARADVAAVRCTRCSGACRRFPTSRAVARSPPTR